jgi:hypothetical protein
MFVQTTTIVLEPATSVTEFVLVLVEAAPFTVQVVAAGIVTPPLTVYVTFVGFVAVGALFAGDVIATTGTLPRLTTTVCVAEPKELVHVTGIVFAPSTSGTEFVLALAEAAPLTVHVVPAGIAVLPFTV